MAKSEAVEVDKDWQAEADARTLADAHEIKSDPKRRAAALKAARKLVSDAEKALKANMTISGKKVKVRVKKKHG